MQQTMQMQILLIHHHTEDTFHWSLSSVNISGNYIFNAYGGTLDSTYTDTAIDTTNLTL